MGSTALSALELLENFARGLPSFYKLLVGIAAIIGLFIFVNAILGMVKSSRAQSKPDRVTLAGLIFGPPMFSLGPWIAAGTNQLWNTSVNKEILDTFEPLQGVSHETALAYVVMTYITFVGWVMMLCCLYVGYEGVRYQEKRWGLKALSMYAAAVFATNFVWLVDAITLEAGYGSVGSQFLPIN